MVPGVLQIGLKHMSYNLKHIFSKSFNNIMFVLSGKMS